MVFPLWSFSLSPQANHLFRDFLIQPLTKYLCFTIYQNAIQTVLSLWAIIALSASNFSNSLAGYSIDMCVWGGSFSSLNSLNNIQHQSLRFCGSTI